jgi:hypothetical protein
MGVFMPQSIKLVKACVAKILPNAWQLGIPPHPFLEIEIDFRFSELQRASTKFIPA